MPLVAGMIKVGITDVRDVANLQAEQSGYSDGKAYPTASSTQTSAVRTAGTWGAPRGRLSELVAET
jgi:hypothetical protein